MLYKYAVLLTNQRRFVKDKYGGTPIVNESVLTWIDFPITPSNHIYYVSETEIAREDSILMSIG